MPTPTRGTPGPVSAATARPQRAERAPQPDRPSYDHPLTPIPITYLVTPVHPDQRLDAPARLHLELRERPGGRWVVANAFDECLDRAGNWTRPDCTDQWRAAHWFDFDEATRIAQAEVRRKVAQYQEWLVDTGRATTEETTR